MRTLKRLLLPLLLAISMGRPAFAQPASPEGQLANARELYASARYDEALALLDDVHPASGANATTEQRTIDQYRSLCLLALGRSAEAETAIGALVTSDPWYEPNETDASPRVRSAFSEVRQKLLPDIARTRYGAAKQAFDRKDYASAVQQFRQVISLLDDPDMGGRLGDLRTLAAGFLDLSTAAGAPPPAPKKAAPASAPPPVASHPDPYKIYTPADQDVVAPSALKQEFPSVPQTLAAQARDHGVLDVVIDEQGRVTSITVRESMHPVYDAMLVNAARDWRYRPATMNGTPVKYRKLIQVNLSR
ncbi:MAG TPA: TonB family protein [Vicinamibacterales bacterium]|nr:TonB family protein [Vicinamibacterales bacterium]